jgi:hypothetical protein
MHLSRQRWADSRLVGWRHFTHCLIPSSLHSRQEIEVSDRDDSRDISSSAHDQHRFVSEGGAADHLRELAVKLVRTYRAMKLGTTEAIGLVCHTFRNGRIVPLLVAWAANQVQLAKEAPVPRNNPRESTEKAVTEVSRDMLCARPGLRPNQVQLAKEAPVPRNNTRESTEKAVTEVSRDMLRARPCLRPNLAPACPLARCAWLTRLPRALFLRVFSCPQGDAQLSY